MLVPVPPQTKVNSLLSFPGSAAAGEAGCRLRGCAAGPAGAAAAPGASGWRCSSTVQHVLSWLGGGRRRRSAAARLCNRV